MSLNQIIMSIINTVSSISISVNYAKQSYDNHNGFIFFNSFATLEQIKIIKTLLNELLPNTFFDVSNDNVNGNSTLTIFVSI